ncbi:hypothetical protein VTN31DRAFT_3664 [Thermomyces dupontii]|uniref:uncharacterized protein n=1 Tax=Talaromyces thermophilus TaxID=28565 RepID=UPI003744864F
MAKDLAKSLEASKTEGSDNLAYTYPCPESHKDFVKILKGVSNDDVHVVVQRIRALHHPRLHPDNKAKLGRFSAVLVEHVAYLAEQADHPPFSVLEALLPALAQEVISSLERNLRKMENLFDGVRAVEVLQTTLQVPQIKTRTELLIRAISGDLKDSMTIMTDIVIKARKLDSSAFADLLTALSDHVIDVPNLEKCRMGLDALIKEHSSGDVNRKKKQKKKQKKTQKKQNEKRKGKHENGENSTSREGSQPMAGPGSPGPCDAQRGR